MQYGSFYGSKDGDLCGVQQDHSQMGLIRAATILAVDERVRTPSLELKCLGTSFNGKNKSFQSLGIQHGRRVIKTHCNYLGASSSV